MTVAVTGGLFAALLVDSDRGRRIQRVALRQQSRLELNEEIIGHSLKRFATDALFVASLAQTKLPPPLHGLDPAVPDALRDLMLSFARGRGDYLQVRVISLQGRELVRVNREQNAFRLLADAELQDKSGRPYFQDCRRQPPGNVAFSGPELNQEHGVIQRPLAPVVRVCTAIAAAGHPLALLVLNFPAAPFLDRLRGRDPTAPDQLWITDARGSWARGPQGALEWGADFGFPPGSRVAEWEGGAVAAALGAPTGTARVPRGWIAVRRVDPAAAIAIPAAGIPVPARSTGAWTMVSFAPTSSAQSPLARPVAFGYAAFLLLAAAASAWTSRLAAARARAVAQLAASELRFRRIVEEGLALVCQHDMAGRLQHVNPAAASALGYSQDELEGRLLAELVPPEHRPAVERYLASWSDHEVIEGDLPILTRAGELRIWHFRNRRLDEGAARSYVLGVALDVTEQRRAEKVLAELATRDSLTGLPNRRGFDEQLLKLHAAAERHRLQKDAAGAALTVGILDLDGFKAVNDRLGHATGDALLRAVGDELAGAVRRSDQVARLGGDEFALLLPESGDTAALERLAAKVVAAVRAVAGTVAPGAGVTASLGLARLSPTGQSADELMLAADRALYVAKRAGRDRFHIATG